MVSPTSYQHLIIQYFTECVALSYRDHVLQHTHWRQWYVRYHDRRKANRSLTNIQAFNHSQSSDAEAEYDRLRDLARKEQSQHQHWAAEARQAYERGDGASAHEASQKSKQFAAQADDYNKQASDYIFRQNNAVGRVDSDAIDLHGQFVEEAEEIVTQRIKYAQQNGQTHLHV